MRVTREGRETRGEGRGLRGEGEGEDEGGGQVRGRPTSGSAPSPMTMADPEHSEISHSLMKPFAQSQIITEPEPPPTRRLRRRETDVRPDSSVSRPAIATPCQAIGAMGPGLVSMRTRRDPGLVSMRITWGPGLVSTRVTWGPELVSTRVTWGPVLVSTRATWGPGLVSSMWGWHLL